MNEGYVTVDPAQPLPEGYDAYVVAATYDDPPPAVPEGFTIERIALRSWWLPDWPGASVGDVTRWLFTRHTWNPTGSSDQWIIRRV